jgi:predicted transcriptional regulator
MKVKTSITLSAETLHAVDRLAGKTSNRSRIIEQAIVEFVERRARARRDARDRALIDAAADDLNREMAEVLEFQVEP